MIVSKPFCTSSAFCMLTSTPPASVLWRISGDTIFRTTGKPIPVASFAASAADVATASFGTGMPYASQTSLPSGAVSDVRPSAFTWSRIRLTSVLLFAMIISLDIERGGASRATDHHSSDCRSDHLVGAQRRHRVLAVAKLGEHFVGVLAEERRP